MLIIFALKKKKKKTTTQIFVHAWFFVKVEVFTLLTNVNDFLM